MIAAACCLWRAVAHPKERKPWLVIGLGMVSFAAADLYYTIALQPLGDDIPYPSLADALYLGLYPCCFVGLLLLARCRAGRLPWMLWVDGLIVALGFAAVASALVYGRVLDSTGGDPLTVATNLAYPMSDILLLGLVAGLLGVFGLRGWRAWSAVICGFALLGVADTIYLWRVANGTYEVGGVLDAAWPAGMVLVGAAAWQRPRRLDARAVADRGFLPVPLIAGLCATGLLVTDHYERLDQSAVWAAAGCILAVVVRLGGTFREYAGMLRTSRHEAATDALTGLQQPPLADRRPRRAGSPPTSPSPPCSRSSTSTASRPTTTPSATRPATLLLRRLGARLAELGGRGVALPDGRRRVLRAAARRRQRRPSSGAPQPRRSSESGEGFTVGASCGAVALPGRGPHRLRGAAHRRPPMYAQKSGGRTSASTPAEDVLLRALARARARPRRPRRRRRRAGRARRRAASGSTPTSSRRSARRAELHDVGKLAIPDTILQQARPARRRRVGLHAPATRCRRAHPGRRARAGRVARSCARATSAGTATATPTGSPARRSRSARASSRSATRTTR